MPFALGLQSGIPVIRERNTRRTLDLWARDLEVQLAFTSRLKLFCPISSRPPAGWTATSPLPAGIEVVDVAAPDPRRLRSALAGCDVLQVPGNQGWRDSRVARRMLAEARRLGIRCIVGISSNRAHSNLLNARSRGLPAWAVAAARSADILFTQRVLTARADGTFVVGEALRPLVSRRCRSLHVSVASWIRSEDLRTAALDAANGSRGRLLALCIASRLERMKGVHVGVEAFARLCREAPSRPGARLTILGAGPERAALERQAKAAGIAERVTFGGSRSYPDAFFAELRRHGAVLLTNLGDEQPRLVFDAISQGCLPLCPASSQYAALGLPAELLYAKGDPGALARAIRRLWGHPRTPELLGELRRRAGSYTLESMHRARAAWIEAEVLAPQLVARSRRA